jgi:pimeloyl-ACP methyl ester carboxylesterase
MEPQMKHQPFSKIVAAVACTVVALSPIAIGAQAAPAAKKHIKNIVLVHGAWADGSGFEDVYKILVKDGYTVSVVANPNTGLPDDVAATERVLQRQDGPVVLVGHSYGGAVITEAGNNDKVVALVYLAAFMPDAGETVFGFFPKDGPQPPIEPTADGLAFFNRDAYLAGFAQDLPPAKAAFMADSQVPIAFAAGTTPIKAPAWRTKRSWYLISTEDHVIPPEAQHMMAKRANSTWSEVKGSHVAFMSHPAAAAKIIEQAAE